MINSRVNITINVSGKLYLPFFPTRMPIVVKYVYLMARVDREGEVIPPYKNIHFVGGPWWLFYRQVLS